MGLVETHFEHCPGGTRCCWMTVSMMSRRAVSAMLHGCGGLLLGSNTQTLFETSAQFGRTYTSLDLTCRCTLFVLVDGFRCLFEPFAKATFFNASDAPFFVSLILPGASCLWDIRVRQSPTQQPPSLAPKPWLPNSMTKGTAVPTSHFPAGPRPVRSR